MPSRARWRRDVCALALTAFGAAAASAQNAIEVENQLPGNPPSEWDISGAGDPSSQGFATELSVDQARPCRSRSTRPRRTTASTSTGSASTAGSGRKVATVGPSAELPQSQPACVTEAASGLVDCGNWEISASWEVPSDATSEISGNGRPVSDDGTVIVGHGLRAGVETAFVTYLRGECSDGIDNDGDHQSDYPADAGCSSGCGDVTCGTRRGRRRGRRAR